MAFKGGEANTDRPRHYPKKRGDYITTTPIKVFKGEEAKRIGPYIIPSSIGTETVYLDCILVKVIGIFHKHTRENTRNPTRI